MSIVLVDIWGGKYFYLTRRPAPRTRLVANTMSDVVLLIKWLEPFNPANLHAYRLIALFARLTPIS